MLGFGDRSKRIAKIADSAAPHLEDGEEVRELVQVQTGRTAEDNAAAVRSAYLHGSVNKQIEAGIRSFAVLATDRNLYIVTLTGTRLLDVGEVVFKESFDNARVSVEDKVITIDDVRLHVMNHYESHVAGLRDLLASAPSPS